MSPHAVRQWRDEGATRTVRARGRAGAAVSTDLVRKSLPGKRAAIYTRVSSEEQVEGTSLDEQRERCEQEAQRRGLTVVEVFCDEGYSGAAMDRPALGRLLASLRDVDVVIVAKTDRLARDQLVRLLLTREFRTAGVEFVALDQPMGEDTIEGELMGNILGAFGQFERGKIAQRTRSGVVRRVEAGGWGGGNVAPYGYRIVGEGRTAHLQVDEREAEVIREAVRLFVDEGMSSGQVARTLNAVGLVPRHASVWTSQNLRNCLSRGQFDGVWTFGKTVSKGKRVKAKDGTVTVLPRVTAPAPPVTVQVPPIVTPERMEALRAALQGTSLLRGAAGVHPLSGRLFCECGAHMTGIARGDRANRRYRCRFGRHEPGRPFCAYPSLLADAVDDAVWQQVLVYLVDPAALEAAADEYLDLLGRTAEVDEDALTTLDREVAVRQQALADSTGRCLSLGLDEATMRGAIRQVQQEYDDAVSRRAALVARRAQAAQQAQRAGAAQTLAEVAGERLATADREWRAAVLAGLGVTATVTGRDEDGSVLVRVEGSVLHDLLLAGLTDPLAPAVLATAGRAGQVTGGVPFRTVLRVAA